MHIVVPQNMVVQGTGQSPKYDGAGDRSVFGRENMVVQGTGPLKIWWYRGQVSQKSRNIVVQGTGPLKIWWCRGQVKRER
jgi:hypothetical protein